MLTSKKVVRTWQPNVRTPTDEVQCVADSFEHGGGANVSVKNLLVSPFRGCCTLTVMDRASLA